MLMVVALTVMMAAQAQPVTIYVGPATHDGFVDVDKGVAESIKDLRKQLGKRRALLLLVEEPERAAIRLEVVSRSMAPGGSSTSVAIGSANTAPGYASGTATTVNIDSKVYRVETVLRAGGYERPFVSEKGELALSSTWGSCAEQIAKDVAVWVDANRERITSGKAAR